MTARAFSQRQVEVLAHAEAGNTSLFAGGAVRSGKSHAVLLSFAIWTAALPKRYDHAVVGQSVEAVMRNMGFDFIDAVNAIKGASARIDKTFGTRIVVKGKAEQSIWIIGANDAKARRRIQGSTLKGLVVEELALLPEDFFNMAWARLSESNAKMWASYNPEGPAHWAKRRVIDRADDYGGKVLHFRMRDNPSLDDEVLARYERSFHGHFYRRYISGEWAAAEGACYPDWEVTDDDFQHGTSHLAIDWAASGTLACLQIRARGRQAVVTDEMYHEGKTEGLMNEIDVAARIATWAGRPMPCWIDPSAPNSFKNLLRRKGLLVRGADNDVVPGIVTTAGRLASGEVKIHRRCEKLQTELSSYVWDDAASEKGEDKPLKKADHGCDALRYWAHSTGKAYRAMKPARVREALA